MLFSSSWNNNRNLVILHHWTDYIGKNYQINRVCVPTSSIQHRSCEHGAMKTSSVEWCDACIRMRETWTDVTHPPSGFSTHVSPQICLDGGGRICRRYRDMIINYSKIFFTLRVYNVPYSMYNTRFNRNWLIEKQARGKRGGNRGNRGSENYPDVRSFVPSYTKLEHFQIQ